MNLLLVMLVVTFEVAMMKMAPPLIAVFCENVVFFTLHKDISPSCN